MIHTFNASIHQEGSRFFVTIPFDVWQETGRKGNIPCRIRIGDLCFECRLVPKGNGRYMIPVAKKTALKLTENEYTVEMEPVDTLSRINHDSPYSLLNPIRNIDHIDNIPIQSGICGHTCVAMLAGVPVEEVITIMGKSPASWSKILECLDYYGIAHASKALYPKGKNIQMPPCCIVYNDNGFVLWYKGSFYGVENVDMEKTVSLIEIAVI
ncbi:MAG: DUF1905 domain-containing protein [Bulleidia sp.]